MEFFGMGMGEILFILALALVIWGPGKIVEIGRTLGKMTNTFKKATLNLSTLITEETEAQEKKEPPRSIKNGQPQDRKSTNVNEQ
ncbi:twin-arginine translocase TatA/TatE family subunit [Chloroflexota bacterium]